MTVACAIDAYPSSPSVPAGETLTLHVSTSASRFRVDIYRFGQLARHMDSFEWSGKDAPPGRFDEDWQWPAYEMEIPSDWPSGVYIAVLSTKPVGSVVEQPRLDGRTARALFVVTPSRQGDRARILYKIPVFTYHAYNTSGGGSLYGSLRTDDSPSAARSSRVSLRRPGGGVGGPVKGLPDVYDLGSPRQTFAHWDAKFVAWLERNGVSCDFCTDLDLHEGRLLGDGYRLLLSTGHDEYWSAPTRYHVEQYRDSGGNIANFGANTCWWRVTVSAGGRELHCEKFPPGAPDGADPDSLRGAPDHWWETAPENSLLGVSYRNAGGHWDGLRTPIGFRVQHPDHWVFEDTGLRTGDVFGQADALVGYECDGAALTFDPTGRAQPTFEDGTPKGFRVLGFAELPEEPGLAWQFAARETSASPRAATLGLYTQGGSVFTVGTTDWARLLSTDLITQTITRNVLNRLS